MVSAGVVLAGTVVIMLILAIRAFVGRAARAEREHTSSTRSGSSVTNRPRVRLRPCANPKWTDPEAAQSSANQLHELGFHDAGTFSVVDAEGYFVRAFVKPEEATWATIEELTSMPGPWVEVAVVRDDGNLYSLSNQSRYSPSNPVPGTILRREPGLDAAGLYAKMLAERPAGPLRPASAEGFVAMYEDYQNRFRDWFSLRGGLNDEQLRALAVAKGIDASDAQIAQWRTNQQRRAWEHVRQMAAEHYFATAALSDDDQRRMTRLWRRGLLVVVADTMPMRALSQVFGKSVEEVRELLSEHAHPGIHDDWLDGEASLTVAKLPPRQAFIALNEQLPEARQFHKIATMDEPLPCDLYATVQLAGKNSEQNAEVGRASSLDESGLT